MSIVNSPGFNLIHQYVLAEYVTEIFKKETYNFPENSLNFSLTKSLYKISKRYKHVYQIRVTNTTKIVCQADSDTRSSKYEVIETAY